MICLKSCHYATWCFMSDVLGTSTKWTIGSFPILHPLYVDFYCYKYTYARWPFSTVVRVPVFHCVARAKATCCATKATLDHSSSPPHLWEELSSIKFNILCFNKDKIASSNHIKICCLLVLKNHSWLNDLVEEMDFYQTPHFIRHMYKIPLLEQNAR